MMRIGSSSRFAVAITTAWDLLCTVRFLSTFVEDLQSIPAGVVNNVARQLAIDNPSCYAQYCAGEQRWEHAAEIRTRYGYQDFSAGPVRTRPGNRSRPNTRRSGRPSMGARSRA